MVAPVEFARAGEGDVVDIEIEAHADGVGGDEEIDFARLIKRDLCIAGARAQRAQHHRGAAALPADQLGDGVNVVRGERHDGRTGLQPRDLLLARIGELRQARPGDEVRARNKLADRIAHGLRAKQQRLALAPRVEQPLGEDVATVEIGGKLDLVNGEEVDLDAERHGLDRADPIARALGLDLLLARYQRDLVRADPGDDLVVDLPRQKPKRQADQPRLVAEHPLDGEMRLAGVRGAKHGVYMP